MHTHRPFLDTVRWVSAAIVAAGHVIGILNSSANGSEVLTLLANMRAPAVTIFFVLSGYLVGGLVVRNPASFSLSRYLIARFSRIYIALVPALALTLLLDWTVLTLDPTNPIYTTVWQGGALGADPIIDRYGGSHFIGSIFSLEPIFGRPLGSAGILWSLGYEWMFYISFPLVYGLGFWLGGAVGGFLASSLSVLVVFFLSKVGAMFWLVWLMGAFAAAMEDRFQSAPGVFLKTLKIVTGVALLAYFPLGELFNPRVTVLLAAVCGMLFLASGPQWEVRLTSRWDAELAGFSYSLYITHLQIMTALSALCVAVGVLPQGGLANPISTLGLSVVFLAVSFAAAYAFGQVFERRTKDLNRLLQSWLSLKPSRKPSSP